MATPAAVLSILVKAQGVQAAAGQLGALDKTARRTSAGLATTEGNAKKASKSFSMVGTAAKSAGVLIGAAGLAKGIKTAFSEFQEAQKVGAQTTAVLKSTGNAAKVTARDIQNLAGAISRKTGIDDEAIQSSENMLLTFTKLRNETGKGNDIFNQATQVVTDMSVALGQSGKSSAIQLGKALQDPVKGVTALRRVGVMLTQQQQDQVKAMVASGNTLGAQKLILRELKTEFGGSAAAQATAADKFKVSLNNLAEAAGSVLVPVLNNVMGVLTRFFNQMTQGVGVGGALISKFRELGGALAPFGQSIAQIVGWLQKNETAARALAIGLGVLAVAITGVSLAMAVNPFVAGAVAIAALVVGVVTAYREFATFRNVVNTVVAVLGAVAGALSSAAAAVIGAFHTMVSVVRSSMNAIVTEVHKWDVLAAVVRVALTVIQTYVRVGFTVISGIVKTYMAVIAAVFRTGWAVVKAIFSGAFTVLKGIITGGGQILSGAVKVVEGILRGDFRRMWDGIKTIFRGAMTAVKGILTGSVQVLSGAAKAIGNGIKDAFSGALKSALGIVTGFINKIIDVINMIPFIKDVPHVGGGGAKADPTKSAAARTGGLARGGAFGMTGGTINKPMVMMGEEAPRYPEFVIPTNPAYRSRAKGLLGQAAGTIGFKKGGIVGGALGAVGDVLGAGAGALIGKLPGVGSLPSFLKSMGTAVLAKTGAFIKGKVKAAIAKALPGGGGATGGKGISGGLAAARSIAAHHFPYSYGGGHNAGFAPSADIRGTGAFGYDCSGYVSAILHGMGLMGSPMSTDGLKNFGMPGAGQSVTIGVRGSSGLNAHTMIKMGGKYFEAGGGHGAAEVGGWDGVFPILRHPGGMAKGGIIGELPPALVDPKDPKFVGWGLKKGGIVGLVKGGAVGGKEARFRDIAQRVWAAQLGVMGQPSLPLPGIRVTGLKNAYANADQAANLVRVSPKMLDAFDKEKGGSGGDYALSTLIHEFAHMRQGALKGKNEVEGGAEAFALRYGPGIYRSIGMNVPFFKSGAYGSEVAWVARNKSQQWVKHGQFLGDGPAVKANKPASRFGLQGLANLWVRGGGKSSIAGLMAHVAMAESGGNPRARNPSGASGLWQILGQPFKGDVFDPLTNAKMAVWKYKHQGLGAWNASKAAWGKYVGKPGISPTGTGTGKTGGGGSAGGGAGGGTAGAGAAVEKVTPYQQAIAGADLDIAQVDAGGSFGTRIGGGTLKGDAAEIAAKTAKRKIIGAEIKRIRNALAKRKGMTPQKKLDLTTRLSGLLGEHTGLGTEVQDLRKAAKDALPTADDFAAMRASQAKLTPGLGDDLTSAQEIVGRATAAYQKAVSGGDPRKIMEAADALKSASDNLDSVSQAMKDAAIKNQFDWSDASIALASLTESLDDDRAALEQRRALDAAMLADAQARGAPADIAQYANALHSDMEAIKALEDTIKKEADARAEHTKALQDVKDELKRQTDFAAAIQGTESFQLKKYLADVLSSQIGGYGVVPRSYTPGSGVAHRF